jgi:hypothetical protein
MEKPKFSKSAVEDQLLAAAKIAPLAAAILGPIVSQRTDAFLRSIVDAQLFRQHCILYHQLHNIGINRMAHSYLIQRGHYL